MCPFPCTYPGFFSLSFALCPLPCPDEDLCAGSVCQQTCSESSDGRSFICSCQDGYLLNKDQRTCRGTVLLLLVVIVGGDCDCGSRCGDGRWGECGIGAKPVHDLTFMPFFFLGQGLNWKSLAHLSWVSIHCVLLRFPFEKILNSSCTGVACVFAVGVCTHHTLMLMSLFVVCNLSYIIVHANFIFFVSVTCINLLNLLHFREGAGRPVVHHVTLFFFVFFCQHMTFFSSSWLTDC